MIRTIIFDLGGVICPDADSWSSVYTNIVSKLGLNSEQIDRVWDRHWKELSVGKEDMIDFFEELSNKSENKISKEKLLKYYYDDSVIYEDVFNLVKKLKESGYTLLLLSNQTKAGMKNIVKKFGLNDVFNTIYNSADLGMTKNNPNTFRLIIKKERLNPKGTLFIDDRKHNVEMAESFGMQGILYENLQQLKEEIKQHTK